MDVVAEFTGNFRSGTALIPIRTDLSVSHCACRTVI